MLALKTLTQQIIVAVLLMIGLGIALKLLMDQRKKYNSYQEEIKTIYDKKN